MVLPPVGAQRRRLAVTPTAQVECDELQRVPAELLTEEVEVLHVAGQAMQTNDERRGGRAEPLRVDPIGPDHDVELLTHGYLVSQPSASVMACSDRDSSQTRIQHHYPWSLHRPLSNLQSCSSWSSLGQEDPTHTDEVGSVSL